MNIKNSNDKLRILKKIRSKEIKLTALSIGVVLIVLISSSYAIFSSVQKAKKYNTIRVGDLQINFTDVDDGLGNVINLNGAYPESDEVGQKSTPYVFKINNTGSITASYNIKLLDDTDMIEADGCSTNQLDKSKIKYSINGETPSILSAVSDSDYIIISGSLSSGESKTYSLRVWLDESAGNEVLGRHYHGKIVLEGENAMENPNSPQLTNNMIPVIYDDELKQWVKSNTKDHTWYDYSTQKWANAVTVTEANRDKYLEANVGTQIAMEDINTMWVWIPRYSYTLGNTYGYQTTGANTPSQATPGAFNIKWIKSSVVDKGTATYTGETPDNYYTPTAFCFGNSCETDRNNSENKELSGIWVAKFETGGGTGNVATPNIALIKPNINSWKTINTQTIENLAFTMNDSGNVYGISTESDVHEIKNDEWGAVAYLSQSKYGKYGNTSYTGANKEIYINNYSSGMTGCSKGSYGAGEEETDISSTCLYTYDNVTDRNDGTGAAGAGASTTGNIYGIYDMAGGLQDSVIGNYSQQIGTSGFSSLPERKYYNLYSTDNVLTACNNGICLSHSMSETSGWYIDQTNMLNTTNVWLTRGGSYNQASKSGIFGINSNNGDTSDFVTARFVMINQ